MPDKYIVNVFFENPYLVKTYENFKKGIDRDEWIQFTRNKLYKVSYKNANEADQKAMREKQNFCIYDRITDPIILRILSAGVAKHMLDIALHFLFKHLFLNTMTEKIPLKDILPTAKDIVYYMIYHHFDSLQIQNLKFAREKAELVRYLLSDGRLDDNLVLIL